MRDDCRCSGRRCEHCRHGHEDTRWALPALGVILAVAFVGLVREHGHGALEAAQVAGYAAFGLSVLAAAVLVAWRVRKRRARARALRVQAVITSARRGRISAAATRAIRQGRPTRLALPRRHDQAGS